MWIFSGFFPPSWQEIEYLWVVEKQDVIFGFDTFYRPNKLLINGENDP